MVLGIAIAAIEIVPLGFYLARSPVWGDRDRARSPAWTFTRPRVLDAACTALPYVYGSQRRGQPNLARALGVHNLNESAGGFAGLATLVWLAPIGWRARRSNARLRFLAALAAFGALGAFGLPPVDNLLRALPVLNVADNRRLSLWLAFGLVFLGGAGLDALGAMARERSAGWGGRLWIAGAIALCAAALAAQTLEPRLRARSYAHYAKAAAETPGADAAVYRERAERQVRQTLDFLPRYLLLGAAQLAAIAALAEGLRRGLLPVPTVRGAALALTLLDLFAFGYGLNPAIAARDDRPISPVIAYLKREVGGAGRVLGLGEELPPNTLMRYGLNDVRNYDSVELSRSFVGLSALYEPGSSARTSRREVTWAGVVRCLEALRDASVEAVVAAVPPPQSRFEHVDRVGDVWIARLGGRPIVEADARDTRLRVNHEPGRFAIDAESCHADRLVVRAVFVPGWCAVVDGRPATVELERGKYLAVRIPSGAHRVELRYAPREVKGALAVSLAALAAAVFGLTGFCFFRFTRMDTRGLEGTSPPGYNRFCDLHRTSQPAHH